ncbi:MAG TPA: decarboxylating 6-phosphogluconate dehydrogenase [Vicinamibacterales bacterium]|jgi:6-phosphogluconate dehydrogenase|nr:decarboxylating 6-phosphogluconate dehydrogenase [Vicinamibacterales bacterium]
MQIGLVGLGRMGGNMARRLARGGHTVVAWDQNAAAVSALGADAIVGASSIDDLVARLDRPRAVWIMVPAGDPTEQTVNALATRLEADDTIIDGGNSYYKDDVRRARSLRARGVQYVDVGTSGGVWGAERGYCLMIGGPDEAVSRLTPVFRTLAPGQGDVTPTPRRHATGTAHEGFLHCGPVGAGHFVKMIHNGIEYGLMQAYAEGFDLLRNASSEALPEDARYDLNLADIAEVWRRGSVVGSWLLDLAAIALAQDPMLDRFAGRVADSGEGRWTVIAAIEESVPAEAITTALFTRFRSRRDHTFAERMLSALRAQFGGHVES